MICDENRNSRALPTPFEPPPNRHQAFRVVVFCPLSSVRLPHTVDAATLRSLSFTLRPNSLPSNVLTCSPAHPNGQPTHFVRDILYCLTAKRAIRGRTHSIHITDAVWKTLKHTLLLSLSAMSLAHLLAVVVSSSLIQPPRFDILYSKHATTEISLRERFSTFSCPSDFDQIGRNSKQYLCCFVFPFFSAKRIAVSRFSATEHWTVYILGT